MGKSKVMIQATKGYLLSATVNHSVPGSSEYSLAIILSPRVLSTLMFSAGHVETGLASIQSLLLETDFGDQHDSACLKTPSRTCPVDHQSLFWGNSTSLKKENALQEKELSPLHESTAYSIWQSQELPRTHQLSLTIPGHVPPPIPQTCVLL